MKTPRLLLLDEPLSNLDARLRLEMREEIRRIQQRTGVTTIFVTHDQEEAMSISDRIVLMKLGVLQQNDLPQNLYDQPANQFVADFLGNPPINNLRGVVKGGRFELEDGSASCDCSLCAGAGEGRRVTLALRAESAVVGQEGPRSDFHLPDGQGGNGIPALWHERVPRLHKRRGRLKARPAGARRPAKTRRVPL